MSVENKRWIFLYAFFVGASALLIFSTQVIDYSALPTDLSFIVGFAETNKFKMMGLMLLASMCIFYGHFYFARKFFAQSKTPKIILFGFSLFAQFLMAIFLMTTMNVEFTNFAIARSNLMKASGNDSQYEEAFKMYQSASEKLILVLPSEHHGAIKRDGMNFQTAQP